MRAIVVSATSDIGSALYSDWVKKGWEVVGTSRKGAPHLACDLAKRESIHTAASKLPNEWDVLLFASGTLEPIGYFAAIDFDQWERGLHANFIGVMRLLHLLLPKRRKLGATVLFFAGAGTNGPAPSYSCYTLSKIALIKSCELLDAEISDTRFMIVGPGWVKTKIHQETLRAKQAAGHNYKRTQQKIEQGDWTSMQEVIDCCNWLIETTSPGVSGRNFSVAFDRWGVKELEKRLEEDPDMYKLRRNQ